MNKTTMIRRVGSVAAAVAFFGMAAGPAFAATISQADGTAIKGTLLGQPLINTGTQQATNTGGATDTKTSAGALALLPGQGTTGVGAVSSTAVAKADANSAACAGAVGKDGTISIGNDLGCTTDNGTEEIALDLGTTAPLLGIPLGLPISLTADAIYAECTAGPGGYTATPHVVNLHLHLGAFTLPVQPDGTIVGLTGILAPLSGLIDIKLLQKSVTATEASATALHVTVLGAVGGAGLADITIGEVHCGPNAAIADVPVLPSAGIPLALGVFTIGGLAGIAVYRRKLAVAHNRVA